MKISVLLLMILLLFTACTQQEESGGTIISSGSSFGECLGYCSQKIEISMDVLVYTASSWDTLNYPTLDTHLAISSTEWNELIALVDLSILQTYEDVIGCPDCADGGAEWIKVESSEGSKQITFEYGDSLNSIQPLIDTMRNFRSIGEQALFHHR